MRYMAPEVANGNPYNASCDCYSFAILLWEIMSLSTPFEMYTPKSLRARVYNGPHKRPPVDESWSPAIKQCLRRGWSEDLHTRNTMSQVRIALRKECVRVRDGDDTGLEHYQRRSTFVFRNNPTRKKRRPSMKDRAAVQATVHKVSPPREKAVKAKKSVTVTEATEAESMCEC